ncbi:MAG: hypothetical protein AB7T38_06825 [Nitrospirales bacterium]
MTRGALSLLIILVWMGTVPFSGWAQPDLQYQPRSQEPFGSWREGIKPKPVSGFNVELISVLADYQEPLSSSHFPNSITVQFYLDEQHAVYVTVRELDYRTYYWLDKVQPARTWEKGFQNFFTWPTDPVLQQLTPRLDLYDLGVLIRLDAESTSSVERVAPAVLYDKTPPLVIDGYLFTLKTGEDAQLKVSITHAGTGKEVGNQTFRRKRAGRPFTIHWDAKGEGPGPYTLELSGNSLSTDQTFSKEIHFYHQPTLAP